MATDPRAAGTRQLQRPLPLALASWCQQLALRTHTDLPFFILQLVLIFNIFCNSGYYEYLQLLEFRRTQTLQCQLQLAQCTCMRMRMCSLA